MIIPIVAFNSRGDCFVVFSELDLSSKNHLNLNRQWVILTTSDSIPILLFLNRIDLFLLPVFLNFSSVFSVIHRLSSILLFLSIFINPKIFA